MSMPERRLPLCPGGKSMQVGEKKCFGFGFFVNLQYVVTTDQSCVVNCENKNNINYCVVVR